jgi:hypothetical protein
VRPAQPPLPLPTAAGALARCAARTAVLLARRRIHQPVEHVGRRLGFADGTAATVYRETVVDRGATVAPTVLVVGFRLRWARRSWAHACFRLESVLNTVFFVGFPGFVSKLWLAHDGHGVYRGVYEWDDPVLAERYVRALWWVLSLVGPPRSIRWAVLPGLHRDALLADPTLARTVAPDAEAEWWRLVDVGARTA